MIREHDIDIDGLRLHADVYGEQSVAGEPVVLLHGFTGSAAGWREVAEALAPTCPVIAIDIVGHGRSDAPADLARYQMRRVVDDLVAVLHALGHERACWLGYSMGARTALQVGVHRPDAVSALVLESGTPGLATAEERADRVRSDEALAQRVEREGVEAFVDYWESIPLFASQRTLPASRQAAIRAGRTANQATGLANSLRGMGTGAQEPLFQRLAEVRVPVLLLAGSLDAKFVAIGQEMARALPDGTMHVLPGVGHAAHLEQPEAFTALVLPFVRRVGSRIEAGERA